ncbi:MAG: hypothetical protein K2X39_04660 [Silvanigrellaceae bacterium]|nr:hypothetical protein [Silvanigrellaceae bacterium]
MPKNECKQCNDLKQNSSSFLSFLNKEAQVIKLLNEEESVGLTNTHNQHSHGSICPVISCSAYLKGKRPQLELSRHLMRTHKLQNDTVNKLLQSWREIRKKSKSQKKKRTEDNKKNDINANFNLFHYNVSNSKMVQIEATKANTESPKDFKEIMTYDVVEWALTEAQEESFKWKSAAKFIYKAYNETEDLHIWITDPPVAGFPDGFIRRWWSWISAGDTHKYRNFFIGIVQRENRESPFLPEYKKRVPLPQAIGIEGDKMIELFVKGIITQIHLYFVSKKIDFDKNRILSKFRKFLVENSPEPSNFVEESYILNMIELGESFLESNTYQFIVYHLIKLRKKQHSKLTINQIHSPYSLALDIHLIEYSIEKRNNNYFDNPEETEETETNDLIEDIPTNWKTKDQRRRSDIPHIFRKILQKYYSLDGFFRFIKSGDSGVVCKMRGVVGCKGAYYKKENRLLPSRSDITKLTEVRLKELMKEIEIHEIDKKCIYLYDLIGRLKNTILYLLKEKIIEIKSVDSEITIHLALWSDSSGFGKGSILQMLCHIIARNTKDYSFKFRSKSQRLRTEERFRFVFGRIKECYESLSKIGPMIMKKIEDLHRSTITLISNGIEYKFTFRVSVIIADQKAYHIFAGTSGPNSNFPCCLCYAPKAVWTKVGQNGYGALSFPLRSKKSSQFFIDQAKKVEFRKSANSTVFALSGDSNLSDILPEIKFGTCSLHLIINHGENYSVFLSKIAKDSALFGKEFYANCGINPVDEFPVGGKEIRKLISHIPVILKKGDWIDVKIKELVHLSARSFASLIKTLYCQVETDQCTAVRACTLLFIHAQSMLCLIKQFEGEIEWDDENLIETEDENDQIDASEVSVENAVQIQMNSEVNMAETYQRSNGLINLLQYYHSFYYYIIIIIILYKYYYLIIIIKIIIIILLF